MRLVCFRYVTNHPPLRVAIPRDEADVRGKFTVTQDVSDLTRASFLKGVGTSTPAYCRLSTVTYGVSQRCMHRIRFYTTPPPPAPRLTSSENTQTPRVTPVDSPSSSTPMYVAPL